MAKEELMTTESEATDLGLRWPKASNRMFVETGAFRGAWVARSTAERIYRMTKGFHEAGDVLVAESQAERYRAQDLLYPAIFNYRQSLELRLKYLLMAYGPLAGEAPDFRSHDLNVLWSKCQSVILFFEPDPAASDKAALEAVEARIAEFAAVDAASDAFRFAHDTKGRSINLAISEIDLTNLRSVVASLHNFLECVDSHFRYGYDIAPCAH
jgi:predicted DNA binding CopG/RHH family protein